jgi:pimeloyl-ACP methyl ester carboxylesterase
VDGDVTLSYVTQGDPAGPALLLLPGPTDSWRSYELVLAHLPPSIHTVAVSQRGHGDSEKPPYGYRVEDFAGDVVPLLDALRIERAVLAGHSGSCLVARRVAIDAPDRVAGLVLEASPTTLLGNADLEEFVRTVVAEMRDPIDPAVARSLILATASERVDDGMVDRLAADLCKVPASVWHEMFTALLQYDDSGELGRIRAPTLLIWGDRDQIVGRDMQDRLARRIPDATMLVYPGCSHTPRWEDPARFARDVAAFVTPHHAAPH